MSNEIFKLNFNTRKANKNEIVSFIKRSRLDNNIFLNGYNVSKNLKLLNEIRLNGFSKFNAEDKIEFMYFDEMLSIKADKNLSFNIPKSSLIIENPNYFYNVKKAIKINEEDEKDSFFVKSIGFNKEFMLLEIFGDSQEFFFNNIDKKIEFEFLENKFTAVPSVREVKKDRLIVECRIKFENKDYMKIYSDYISEIKEKESYKKFFNTLNKFEEESFEL